MFFVDSLTGTTWFFCSFQNPTRTWLVVAIGVPFLRILINETVLTTILYQLPSQSRIIDFVQLFFKVVPVKLDPRHVLEHARAECGKSPRSELVSRNLIFRHQTSVDDAENYFFTVGTANEAAPGIARQRRRVFFGVSPDAFLTD